MYSRRAQRHLARSDFAGVARECRRILVAAPENAEAHFLLGVAAAHGRRFREAIEHIQKAIAFDEGCARYHADLARCFSMLRYRQRSLDAAQHAAALLPTDRSATDPIENAGILDTIGNVFSRVGRHREASEAFTRAAALAPGNADIQFNLGSSLKFVGRFQEARAAYEKAISVRPRFYRAQWALSDLIRATPARNRIEQLEDAFRNHQLGPSERLHVGHALAKEYEDLGEHELAFGYLRLCKPSRGTVPYSLADDRELFDAITRVCTAAFCADSSAGHQSEEPIFIVGMPRTGTTLVESILSIHRDVLAAGELDEFGLAVKRATRSPSKQILDAQTVERAAVLDFSSVGAAYINGTRPLTGSTPYFIDKLPANFLYAGFIRRALPNAKIICLRRNPLDTCLSNYRYLFSRNSGYYSYSYDLLDTGRYYLLFDALIRHWERVLGANFLVVSYEAVVDDLEGQARRLLEFCDLSWDANVLRFNERTSPVATASAVQVRRGISTKPIGRWRNYRKQLEPLIRLFESHGIECR